ncbi:MAG TPA: 16S rRNA (uracil(1498)-N(3))-methyltransferase [Gammaproteobacteria bacterium]
MRAPRVHVPGPLAAGSEVTLPEAAAHHLARVLRLAPGAELTLFDGSGGEYPATLLAVGRQRVSARLGAHLAREVELPLRVVLAQAVSRGDRMDLTLQKAVELGCAGIVPLLTARAAPLPSGPRLQRRLAHWQGIVTSACEQSGRNRVPAVAPPLALGAWLAQPAAGLRLVLDPDGGRPLRELAPPADGTLALLVGPEGGLAPEELAAARAAGCLPLGLGPRVLRTETAALAALAQVQCLWTAEV